MALNSSRSRCRGCAVSSASVEARTSAKWRCLSAARNRGNSDAGVDTGAIAISGTFMLAWIKKKGGPNGPPSILRYRLWRSEFQAELEGDHPRPQRYLRFDELP